MPHTLLAVVTVALAGSAPLIAVVDGNRRAGPADHAWNLQNARVVEAWHACEARGIAPGAGVVIAHTDTGYVVSDEVPLAGALGGGWTMRGAIDLVENDDDPWDPLLGGSPLALPGHSSHAASVMVSPPSGAVTGVAPAASVLPIRVSNTVITLDPGSLARGIDVAVDAGAHVVLITAGFVIGSAALHAAIARALDHGVIVVAAAGNFVPLVVYPAAYPEVIAVAATGPNDQPAAVSSFGPEVDLAAPGLDVWHTFPHRRWNGGTDVDDALAGMGTTLASAHVAAAAALWLSYHGRDHLLARFGARGLVERFRGALLTTARHPPTWSTRTSADFGIGILDAGALLLAPLE